MQLSLLCLTLPCGPFACTRTLTTCASLASLFLTLQQDQVCYGMYNQATVHQYRAEFLLFGAARAGAHASTVAAAAEDHLKVISTGD